MLHRHRSGQGWGRRDRPKRQTRRPACASRSVLRTPCIATRSAASLIVVSSAAPSVKPCCRRTVKHPRAVLARAPGDERRIRPGPRRPRICPYNLAGSGGCRVLGFFDYVKAAFNARPIGMFVAPNWVGLAAFGLLGVANPGFWVLGAGLELGYLLALSTNGAIPARSSPRASCRRRTGIGTGASQQVARAPGLSSDRRRYETLAERCRSIIDICSSRRRRAVPHGLEAQAESLGRLSWMYPAAARRARRSSSSVLSARSDAAGARQADRPSSSVSSRRRSSSRELRRSLAGQIEILDQRDASARRGRATAHVHRRRARAHGAAGGARSASRRRCRPIPELLSRRIDEIAATLGRTSQWIRDQQQVYGAMEDLLTEPPPLGHRSARAKETPMSAALPRWAAEMRDLFRSGSAAAVPPARQRVRRRAIRTDSCCRCRRSSKT